VGSASRDLTGDDPRGWRLGGGVTYGALTTARLGLATAAIIGVDEPAARAHELDVLRSAGVDLLLVALDESPVFRNLETPAGRRQTAVAVGRPLPRVDLPARWRHPRAWSFVPVAGEVGDEWVAAADRGALVVLGWQGLLRRLTADGPVARRPPTAGALVHRADLVGVSRQDIDAGTSLADLAAHLHPGARLVVTDGAAGGTMAEVGGTGRRAALRYLPTRTDGEVDATGAGDVFLAALLATTLRPSVLGPLRRRVGADLRFAAAAGSLTVEGAGLAGVPDLVQVRDRARRDRVHRLVVPLA
jgi:sugar/nucleoside kinase (ribokinase family)